MKSVVLAAALVSAMAAAMAQGPTWLTVVGDPGNARADTVEADAASAVAFESMRLVKLRVNRAKPRNAFDGLPFQSYYSTAMFDCTQMTAWHRSVALFNKPLWQGQMRMHEYVERDGRDLAFAGMAENPRDRLIKAACAMTLQDK